MMLESLAPWLGFILVLSRILSFLVTAPVFNRRNIPTLTKIGLGMVLSLMITAQGQVAYTRSMGAYVGALTAEVVTGLVAGTIANWLFQSFHMGGQIIDQQAGFGTASMFDPATSTQVSLISNFLLYVGLLLFLQLNGHHMLILGLLRSFSVVPAGAAALGSGLTAVAVNVLMGATILLVRLAIPVVATLILTDITLGMIGRTVPQLNVLMLGLPVKAAVALLVLAAVSPVFLGVGNALLSQLEISLARILGVMVP